jgi:1-acyl-sn-glycerol-3-phosphate acyltransferase
MPELSPEASRDGSQETSVGGKGRPGRGSPTSPSAAARSLASPRPRRRRASPVGSKPGRSGPTGDAASLNGSKPAADPAADAASEPARDGSDPATGSGETTAAPAGGIPASELAGAFSSALRQLVGEAGKERVERMLAFWGHRMTGDYDVDDFGFDPELTSRLLMTALRPIAQKWFRIEVRGIHNVPPAGGALVVGNHSGVLPVDALMTGLVLHDHAGRHLRMLGADLLFTLPFVSALARKSGATLACNEDAERMLSCGELAGVWPEGYKGVGKPYAERYRLQRFGRGGFVAAAMRTGVPIVPCSVVGAEEIYPMIGNVRWLARLLGVPYVPITPLFPWFGLLGLVPLPSKWIIEFGEPIRTDAFPAGAADDPLLVLNVTDQVRDVIQHTLYELLQQRGRAFG